MSGARRGSSGILLLLTIFCSLSSQAAQKVSARQKLVGGWHLVRIDAPGPDGKATSVPQPRGILIYTRDGHMSVQLMYPEPTSTSSNEYVLNGYEASFGSYDVDEAAIRSRTTCRDRTRVTCWLVKICLASLSSLPTDTCSFDPLDQMSTGPSPGSTTKP